MFRPSLPTNVGSGAVKELAGPVVLQLTQVSNLCQPSNRQHLEDGSRLLLLKLTDGTTKLQCLELEQLGRLSADKTPPGEKFRITGATLVRGKVLARRASVEHLGGIVTQLRESWQTNREMLRTGQKAASRAPPFTGLDVAAAEEALQRRQRLRRSDGIDWDDPSGAKRRGKRAAELTRGGAAQSRGQGSEEGEGPRAPPRRDGGRAARLLKAQAGRGVQQGRGAAEGKERGGGRRRRGGDDDATAARYVAPSEPNDLFGFVANASQGGGGAAVDAGLVAQLQGMGFGEKDSEDALRSASGDVNLALEMLLSAAASDAGDAVGSAAPAAQSTLSAAAPAFQPRQAEPQRAAEDVVAATLQQLSVSTAGGAVGLEAVLATRDGATWRCSISEALERSLMGGTSVADAMRNRLTGDRTLMRLQKVQEALRQRESGWKLAAADTAACSGVVVDIVEAPPGAGHSGSGRGRGRGRGRLKFSLDKEPSINNHIATFIVF